MSRWKIAEMPLLPTHLFCWNTNTQVCSFYGKPLVRSADVLFFAEMRNSFQFFCIFKKNCLNVLPYIGYSGSQLDNSKIHSLTDAVNWYVVKITWGFVSFSSNDSDCLSSWWHLELPHFFLDRFVDSKVFEFLKNLSMTRE